MAAIDQLTGLANVIGAFSDKETTTKSSGTKTTQTNVSDAGVQQLLQGILAGPGGVKSIGGAARRSGLYSSSTEDMLLGDLYARAANQAELARSPTTTRETGMQTAVTPGLGMGSLGTVIGGGMLLNSLFGGATGKEGLAGLLGGGGTGGAGLGGLGETLSGLFGGGGGAAGAGASGLSAAGTAGGIGGLATSLGPESVKMLGGAGGTAAAGGSAAGISSLSGLLPYGGAFLGGLLGGLGEGSAKTEDYAGGVATGALTGFTAGGPLGAVAGGLLGALGAGASDISVICTALHKQGLISEKLYVEGHKHLEDLDKEVKFGYYIWATPIADRINAGSKFWKWAMLVPTWCYLTLMASDRGVLDYLENPIGAVLQLVGEPACRLLFRVKLFLKMRTSRI